MDKLFSTDIVQALAYILPGLAALFSVYWFKSEVVSAALQKLGPITSVALIVPAAFLIGIFLLSASALVQTKIEQSLKHFRAIDFDLTERAVKRFDNEQRLRKLVDRLQKTYDMEINCKNCRDCNYSEVYIYSRTLMIKDGGKFYDRTQFYSAASVSCRSLILVSLIIGGTLLWRLGRNDTRRSLVVLGVLAAIILSLFYTKEVYYRLSVHETLRAALLLTADTQRGLK
jgi:hypothetical protein